MAHELRFLDNPAAGIWFFEMPRGWVARLFDGTTYQGELPITASQLMAAVDGAAVIIIDDQHELTIEPDGGLLRILWEPKRGTGIVDFALRIDVASMAEKMGSTRSTR